MRSQLKLKKIKMKIKMKIEMKIEMKRHIIAVFGPLIFFGGIQMASASILNLTVNDINEKPSALAQWRGQVLLVVNTASACGYTPQYNDLEALYQKYRAKGFAVLAFPSNDFGGQEPGSNQEIKKFCDLKTGQYKVSFPMFAKVSVKSSPKSEIYRELTEGKDEKLKGEVAWNFEKFLVNKKGQVVERYKSAVTPMDSKLTSRIEELLAEK
jgi:glutathione peroxidase